MDDQNPKKPQASPAAHDKPEKPEKPFDFARFIRENWHKHPKAMKILK